MYWIGAQFAGISAVIPLLRMHEAVMQGLGRGSHYQRLDRSMSPIQGPRAALLSMTHH